MIEGGVFSPLTSKGHSMDTCPNSVLGSVVPTNLSRLELDRSQLPIPGKQLKPPNHYVTHTSALSRKVVKEGF